MMIMMCNGNNYQRAR